MITAQDIREKTFERKKVGGYDMDAVDDFLEELADDLTASQKEVAMLKSKMQVLVDKINEYRANEETLNMAILSAQKLAVQIETDARTRANAILADADKQVRAQIGSISEKAAAEEKRLAAAQAATEKYIEAMRAACSKELKNLDAIAHNYLPKTEEAAAEKKHVDEAVISIESSVSKIKPEPQLRIDLSDAIAEDQAPAEQKADYGFNSTRPFPL